MNKGWFRINRKLFDNKIWHLDPFTRGQAWVDLIGLANHKDGYILFRGIKIELKRGDVGWSVLALSKRWKWSRGKVHRFLNFLKTENQISVKTDIKTDIKLSTVITVKNYNKYQDKDIKTDIKRTLNGHKTDIKRYTNKKNKEEIKNVKKEKGKYSLISSLKEKDFIGIAKKYDCPVAFVRSKYDDMVNWKESKPSNPKLRNRNWRRTLMTWVKRDSLKIKQGAHEKKQKFGEFTA